jgi:hemoglobin
MDDFGERLSMDERFKRFFGGHSQASQIRQRQLVVDLFCQVTGGPCFYIGRDLKVAHTGLGITKADWDAATKLFGETLVKHKVGEREQQELGALLAPREKDIVEK